MTLIEITKRETREPRLNETPNGSECPGHCCRLFWLPFNEAQLQEVLWAQKRYTDDSEYWPKGVPNYHQASLVADLVVFRGEFTREQLVEYGRRRGLAVPPPPSTEDENKSGAWYTCRCFDPETSLCTIYEARPDMCRNFPWFGECYYPGCTHQKPELVYHDGKPVAKDEPAKTATLEVKFKESTDWERKDIEDPPAERPQDDDGGPGGILDG